MQALLYTQARLGEAERPGDVAPDEDPGGCDEMEAVPPYEAAEEMRVAVSVAGLRQSLLNARQRARIARDAAMAASVQQASFAASSLQVRCKKRCSYPNMQHI